MSYGIKEAIILESFFLFVSADALKFLLYKKGISSDHHYQYLFLYSYELEEEIIKRIISSSHSFIPSRAICPIPSIVFSMELPTIPSPR